MIKSTEMCVQCGVDIDYIATTKDELVKCPFCGHLNAQCNMCEHDNVNCNNCKHKENYNED